jgi:hypothetical protein
MNSGRGGNNRRKPFKRRDRNNDTRQDRSPRDDRRGPAPGRQGSRFEETGWIEKKRGGFVERLRWTPPQLSAEPLPVPNCPWCGKPITDIASAIADKHSGEPVHFDCVVERIGGGEVLEAGDEITYIGGGRFGIVNFTDSPDRQKKPGAPRSFKIKSILEWEDKENRAEWRQSISDHYSVT